MLAPVEATFISIHAPRAGRDLVYGLLANGFTEFQSTRPVRGATDQVHRGELAGSISIHAPRAGRDIARVRVIDARLIISIHAPRAGRDL